LSIAFFILTAALGGCAKYVTPGGGMSPTAIADADINALMAIKPAAEFPAHLAIARIQAPGYQSMGNSGFGSGRYSVVTTRDVERADHFTQLAHMPRVAGLVPINRMLLPEQLDTLKALRTAAARLQADILLVYSFDTGFHVGAQKFLPLNVIAMGFLNNKPITVHSTVSAAFFDVRTEYLYGLAEVTATEGRHASVWSSPEVVDDLRVLAERKAFDALIPELAATWGEIVQRFAPPKCGACEQR
jgi:hypothetical protein